MKSPKVKYWICVVLSFLFSAVPPVVAIAQKFPFWAMEVHPAYTAGASVIVAVIVVLVCFRKTLIPVIMDKLGIKSIPPVFVWALVLGAAIGLEKMIAIIPDIKIVAFAGLIGSAIGWAFSFASSYYDKKCKEAVTNGGN